MRSIQWTLPFVLFACTSNAQYQGPESVEYDAANDRYLISNTQSSSIKALSQGGAVTDFASGFGGAPYGLEIMGDVLYACVGGGVRGFSLATGAQVYTRNLGGTFNNGITTDGQFLYITDFNAQRVYKVDPDADSHTTLVVSTGGTPNGIVWDPVGDRLITVFWGSNAAIKAFDRNTGAVTVLVANTGVGNIDGVTIDCDGNVLIASWSPARISRYPPTFIGPAENLNVPGLSNPADIDFDNTNLRVCIPNSGNNTVTLFDLTCLTSAVAETPEAIELRPIPNPSAGQFRLVPAPLRPEPYVVVDAQGRVVAEGEVTNDGSIDLTGRSRGTYVLRLLRTGRQVQVLLE